MYQNDDSICFRQYLSPGERILWTGRPKHGPAFSHADLIAVPFSLLWCGFVIFWNVSVWNFPETGATDDWVFKLWGLPFLAAGLYILIGRFFFDAWVRKRTSYAVTNERVLILRTSPRSKFTSRDIRSLPLLQLTESRDGTGTIAFDADDVGYSTLGRRRGFAAWAPAASANAQFFRIDNPRRVYEIIRSQAHA
jgi:hypothetical protein